MKIKSISLQGMWSFDSKEPCTIDLADKTIIIGKNNSGKSNILKGIDWFKDYIRQIQSGRGTALPQLKPAVAYRMLDGEETDFSRLLIKLEFSNSEADKLLNQASFTNKKQRIDAKDLLRQFILHMINAGLPLNGKNKVFSLG